MIATHLIVEDMIPLISFPTLNAALVEVMVALKVKIAQELPKKKKLSPGKTVKMT